jgi:hypothetical protein
MKKSIVLGVLVGVIVLLLVSAWLLNTQLSSLQTQITKLQSQNSELENQNSALQNQTIALQNKTQQLQDRIKQLLEQQSEGYSHPVQITSFDWIGGFNPIGSLTLAYPVNVTIQNNGDVDARGLSLIVKLINMYDGIQIGQSGGTDISQIGQSGPPVDTLLPGETREIKTWTYASLDESLADAACVITLKQGDTIIDEWIRSIS